MTVPNAWLSVLAAVADSARPRRAGPRRCRSVSEPTFRLGTFYIMMLTFDFFSSAVMSTCWHVRHRRDSPRGKLHCNAFVSLQSGRAGRKAHYGRPGHGPRNLSTGGRKPGPVVTISLFCPIPDLETDGILGRGASKAVGTYYFKVIRARGRALSLGQFPIRGRA